MNSAVVLTVALLDPANSRHLIAGSFIIVSSRSPLRLQYFYKFEHFKKPQSFRLLLLVECGDLEERAVLTTPL